MYMFLSTNQVNRLRALSRRTFRNLSCLVIDRQGSAVIAIYRRSRVRRREQRKQTVYRQFRPRLTRWIQVKSKRRMRITHFKVCVHQEHDQHYMDSPEKRRAQCGHTLVFTWERMDSSINRMLSAAIVTPVYDTPGIPLIYTHISRATVSDIKVNPVRYLNPGGERRLFSSRNSRQVPRTERIL